jgi:hypothetical protein
MTWGNQMQTARHASPVKTTSASSGCGESAMKEELRRPGNRARKRLSNRQIRSWEQSVFEDF